VMMSSVMPSEKYSCSGSPLMLLKAGPAGAHGLGSHSPVARPLDPLSLYLRFPNSLQRLQTLCHRGRKLGRISDHGERCGRDLISMMPAALWSWSQGRSRRPAHDFISSAW
jgi:hypothetical protein